MAFVEKLEKILNERGITPYRIFTDLGIGVNSINNWKKGSMPKLDTFEKIILYLDIDPRELLELGDDFETKKLDEYTPDERDLIEAYRKCSRAGQITLQEMAAFQASRAKSSGCTANDEVQQAN